MRIAFLNPSGSFGGAERSLLDLLRGLREIRPTWDLYVVVTNEGAFGEELTRMGIEYQVLPFPGMIARLGDTETGDVSKRNGSRWRMLTAGPSILHYARGLRRLMKSFAPDIVHTNGLKMHALGAIAKPRGAELLWHMHDFASSRPVMAPILRYLASRCSVAVANSNSVAHDLRSVCGERLRVTTIPNGVDLESFCPEGEKLELDKLCHRPVADEAVVRVGLVATMAPWKGHAVFLRAIAAIGRDVPIRAYVIGGPIYETATEQQTLQGLKQLSDSLGVSDRVCFTGFLRNIPEAMRALDIVVHASTAPEPFGLVIAEAMASGRPVIVSPAGGAAEITNGAFALCAEAGDSVKLGGQIRALALDANLRETMGKAGRREAEKRFDRRRFCSTFVEVYESLRPAAA